MSAEAEKMDTTEEVLSGDDPKSPKAKSPKAKTDEAEHTEETEKVAAQDAPEDGEEKNEKEKKPRKPKGEGTPKKEFRAGSRTSGRERKEVQRHVPPEALPKAEEFELVVPEGDGTELGDIPNVEKRLGATKSAEQILKKFFSVLYPGQKGGHTKNVVKINIRKFKGFPKDSDLVSKAQERLNTFQNKDIKEIAMLCDVSSSGSKEALVERIVNFLKSPSESGKAYQTKTKSGGSKRKAGSSKKEGGEKRGKSGYILFCEDHREEAKKSLGEGGAPKDVLVKLGEMWREASEKTKAKYNEKSAAASKGKKRKAESEADEEGSGSDSEDEKPIKKAKSDVEAKMGEAIKAILKDADLDKLSVKDVRKQLAETFGEDVVKEKKAWIKETINEAVGGDGDE